MEKLYYCAKEVERGWKGRIYKYDSTGNKEITVWLSPVTYHKAQEAEDASCEYADENDLEVELG